jgi:bifunctional enzyme CysN/CysC
MKTSSLAATDIDAYLKRHEQKSLLRFITCGSVDDGKSTLIGRLLWDTKLIFDDQLSALEIDSKKMGTRGDAIDYALLLDGLSAEREQGITIDVAYRYFTTERRKFIVADTPGHVQYTRNMVTGASTADLAVILVDARKGILPQTRRHSFIAHLLGIRDVVLAINKMDWIDFDQRVFDVITKDYRAFAERIGLRRVMAIAMCATEGDNITARSPRTPWYRGPTLLDHLETVVIANDRVTNQPLRMPVQWVNRPNDDFRGFAGTIASGRVCVGDRICVQPSGAESTVAGIVAKDGDVDEAIADQAITLTLTDEIDCSRGDVISLAHEPAEVADQFETTVVWTGDQPLVRGRSYLMQIGNATVNATVAPLKYKINVDTLEHVAASTLALNEIGVVHFHLDRAIAFDAYEKNRDTGGFILVDRLTNATVGAGMIAFALRRSHNVRWQTLTIDRAARASLNAQRPAVLWLTGLSGAGKSTIANLIEKKLFARGQRTYLLDGDNVRHGLNKDLGFTEGDRAENIRRVAEVAKLMVDAGLIVITAFISPFRAERGSARALFNADEFIEVFIDTPLATAEARDVKGLYKKARSGALKNFTGIDSPYERPQRAEIVIDTTQMSADAAAELIVNALIERRLIN